MIAWGSVMDFVKGFTLGFTPECRPHTIHAADANTLSQQNTPYTCQTPISSPCGPNGNPIKLRAELRAEPRRSRRTRPSKIEAVLFFHKKVIRMKKFKPKTVKWNARVRMYAVDHSYEEIILPPLARANRSQGTAFRGLRLRWTTPRFGCLTCT
jgi:hypothetical protein